MVTVLLKLVVESNPSHELVEGDIVCANSHLLLQNCWPTFSVTFLGVMDHVTVLLVLS